MDKINILWIEDNPLQGSLYVSDLIKRDPELAKVFPKELHGFDLPAVRMEMEHSGSEKYFNLQVLQHPIEIKDYISMTLQLEDACGYSEFRHLPGVLPEVIAFDYQFGVKIDVNIGEGAMSYHPDTLALRKFINPNHRFLERKELQHLFRDRTLLLEQEEAETYTKKDFLKAISRVPSYDDIREKDERDLEDDDFGLFAAIEIMRIFRNHSIVAVPATYAKRTVDSLSLHGKYFEWLNEFECSVDFDRAERGNKVWSFILEDAMKALQLKLLNYLAIGKLDVSFSEINTLATGKMPEEPVFVYENAYGKKSLPLNGVFFYVPAAEREKAIRTWAKKLVKIYEEKTGYSFSKYAKAASESNDLITAQLSEDFERRVELSTLAVQYLNGDIPETDHDLNAMMDYFGIGMKEVMAFRNIRDPRNHKLTRNRRDFRDVDKSIQRLVALMTDIRVHHAYHTFCAENSEMDGENRMMRLLKKKPGYGELMFALFPVPKNPLVLPYHLILLKNVFSKEELENRLEQRFQPWNTSLDNLNLRKGGDFPWGVTPEEFQLCFSFARETGLTPTQLPEWLKNQQHAYR